MTYRPPSPPAASARNALSSLLGGGAQIDSIYGAHAHHSSASSHSQQGHGRSTPFQPWEYPGASPHHSASAHRAYSHPSHSIAMSLSPAPAQQRLGTSGSGSQVDYYGGGGGGGGAGSTSASGEKDEVSRAPSAAASAPPVGGSAAAGSTSAGSSHSHTHTHSSSTHAPASGSASSLSQPSGANGPPGRAGGGYSNRLLSNSSAPSDVYNGNFPFSMMMQIPPSQPNHHSSAHPQSSPRATGGAGGPGGPGPTSIAHSQGYDTHSLSSSSAPAASQAGAGGGGGGAGGGRYGSDGFLEPSYPMSLPPMYPAPSTPHGSQSNSHIGMYDSSHSPMYGGNSNHHPHSHSHPPHSAHGGSQGGSQTGKSQEELSLEELYQGFWRSRGMDMAIHGYGHTQEEARALRMGQTERVSMELKETEQYCTELISLLKPFVPTSSQPYPPRPPPFLLTRFTRLSACLHSSLLTLAPLLSPHLSPHAPSLPAPQSTPSSADKEMDLIRKRRDALIAKAALAAGVSTGDGKKWSDFSAFSNGQRTGDVPGEHGSGGGGAGGGGASAGQTGHKRSQGGGRCHGCGVEQTPEWRRGPDGPRSLCNSCGLHYAKLAKRKLAEEEARKLNNDELA